MQEPRRIPEHLHFNLMLSGGALPCIHNPVEVRGGVQRVVAGKHTRRREYRRVRFRVVGYQPEDVADTRLANGVRVVIEDELRPDLDVVRIRREVLLHDGSVAW